MPYHLFINKDNLWALVVILSLIAHAAKSLLNQQEVLGSRQIRQAIARNSKYKGYTFNYITIDDFNIMKSKFPAKVVGDFFDFTD